jgi:hypothetical protein
MESGESYSTRAAHQILRTTSDAHPGSQVGYSLPFYRSFLYLVFLSALSDDSSWVQPLTVPGVDKIPSKQPSGPAIGIDFQPNQGL